MKTNEKKLSLIGYGLKPSLVMSLNESQINHLHLRMVNQKKNVKEQVTQVPGKPSYKIGDKGGTIPNNPSGKGYALKQNPDKTTTAIPMDEKAVSQKQQEFFGVVRGMQKGDLPKKGKAGQAAKEMSKKDVKDFASTKHKGLPKKVETKEGGYMDMIGKASNKNMTNKIADIQPSLKWESILEDEFSQIIENTIFPKMTKKDFIKTLMESPTIAPDRERTKEKEKEKEKTPDKNDPFRPGKRIQPKPAPKAKHKKEMSEAPEVAPAPVKVPEREKEQTPDKNDPFRPGKRIQPKPAPKAKLPEWMSSESIGLK
jgi:hypothetical protein